MLILLSQTWSQSYYGTETDFQESIGIASIVYFLNALLLYHTRCTHTHGNVLVLVLISAFSNALVLS